MNLMKKMYHATPWSNFMSIVEDGLKPGCDHIVYLAETKEDALKFIAIRVFNEPILVVEVEVEEDLLTETFDHNFNFFKARAWGYPETIPWEMVTNAWKYGMDLSKNS